MVEEHEEVAEAAAKPVESEDPDLADLALLGSGAQARQAGAGRLAFAQLWPRSMNSFRFTQPRASAARRRAWSCASPSWSVVEVFNVLGDDPAR